MYNRPFFYGEYEFRGYEFGSVTEPSLVEKGELGMHSDIAEAGPDIEKQTAFGSLLRTLFAYESLHTLRLSARLGKPGTTERNRCGILFSKLHWFSDTGGQNPIFEGSCDSSFDKYDKHKNESYEYIAVDNLARLCVSEFYYDGMIAMGWGKPLSLHRFYAARLFPLGNIPKWAK